MVPKIWKQKYSEGSGLLRCGNWELLILNAPGQLLKIGEMRGKPQLR